MRIIPYALNHVLMNAILNVFLVLIDAMDADLDTNLALLPQESVKILSHIAKNTIKI
jgi:hypothetical protein